MECMNWEVGSNWYISPTLPLYADKIDDIISIRYSDYTLLSTCRSAIGLVLDKFKGIKRALVPAFTCHSVIEPFNKRCISVKGYPIKSDMAIDWIGLMAMADDFEPDIILIHGYFGFDTTARSIEYIAQLKSRGIIIIEDMTQTMFSRFEHICSDFKLGSIRKWMPIPDGAFLKGLGSLRFEEDTDLSDAKWRAMIAKGEYIFNGNGKKEIFTTCFRDAETMLDSRNEPHAMSGLSILHASHIKEDEFKKVRRDNYVFLAKHLTAFDWMTVIFPELTDDVVPFMLPVLIDGLRADFQHYMAQNNVYPTVIWKCPEEFERHIDNISRGIYDKILCFHIDQRYDMDDMRRVVEIASNFR